MPYSLEERSYTHCSCGYFVVDIEIGTYDTIEPSYTRSSALIPPSALYWGWRFFLNRARPKYYRSFKWKQNCMWETCPIKPLNKACANFSCKPVMSTPWR